MKHIVLVGGGLAGINFIKNIQHDARFQVTLVDRNNYHHFPPLLYQVGTAFIEPSSISYPFRKLFQRKDNLRYYYGKFLRVNPAAKTIETDTGTLSYDYLVLAVGTRTNYFGMEDVAKNALPLKTIVDALSLRNRILLNLEKATRTTDPIEKQKLSNIVIGGGGPTGVEIAGVLVEMGNAITLKEYPELADIKARITLVEAAPVLLGAMSPKAQAEAESRLRKLGLKIILNTAVSGYKDGCVQLSDGRAIPTYSFIWTSGITGREIPGIPEHGIGPGKRVLVDEFSGVQATEDIFAIGDISLNLTDPDYPKGHPQMAQAAIQQGRLLAKNMIREANGEARQPFRYHDKGSMAIISKFRAVADLPNIFLKGPIAWVVWLFIHIIPIAGFRNKLILAVNWFWAFITNDPTLRLIIGIYRHRK